MDYHVIEIARLSDTAQSASNMTKHLADAFACINERMTYPEYLEALQHLKPVPTTKRAMLDKIEKVIFNNPATIVFWSDGTKTVVKCENENFDPEKGLAMAISKKLLGDNQGYYYEVFKKWIPREESKVEETIYADDIVTTVVMPCTAPVLKEEETYNPVKDALYPRKLKDSIYKTYYTPTGEEI